MNLVWCVAADAVARLPVDHGAYVLEWRIEGPVRIAFGGRGEVELGRGRFRYIGSAWGPGGLVARVTRHLRPRGRRDRWHVDALTRAQAPDRVGWCVGGRECDLVAACLRAGWTAPLAGFGSSDCRRCPAHLVVRVDGEGGSMG